MNRIVKKTLELIVLLVCFLVVFGPMMSLFIWSVAHIWYWPSPLPQEFGFDYWKQALGITKSMAIGAVSIVPAFYLRPANKFVAGFMGTTTFVSGTVTRVDGERCIIRTPDGLELVGSGRGFAIGSRVSAAVRPESIVLLTGAAGTAAVNRFETVIDHAFFTGELVDYQLRLGSVFLRARGDVTQPREAEERVNIRIDPERLPIVADTDAA